MPAGYLLWPGALTPPLLLLESVFARQALCSQLVHSAPHCEPEVVNLFSLLQATMMVVSGCGTQLREKLWGNARHASWMSLSCMPGRCCSAACGGQPNFAPQTNLQGHRKFITSIAWEPAHIELPCRRFCSGSKDATIKVWEASTR